MRTGDGSGAWPPQLPPGTTPGSYRPTPPNLVPPVFTHWPKVTPFALTRAISPKTATLHVSNILSKLGVTNRVQAATIAHLLGVITPST
jgi:hypothetical protein